jgi:hypothetical protein
MKSMYLKKILKRRVRKTRQSIDIGDLGQIEAARSGILLSLPSTVADAWGVPAALSVMAFMPPLGLLLSLFLPAAAFHRRVIK